MTAEQAYVAVDMGASGGRVLAGAFDGDRIRLEELHRFENGAISAAGHLYWDVLALWKEVQEGLRAAAQRHPRGVASVGVDTWGVDFALLGRGDVLLGNPHSYRDPRCEGMIERATASAGREEIFAQTGLQFMPFNTLYQLLAMRVQGSPLLEMAQSLLMMPDFFHWLLTGIKANEYTNATTTQFFNPARGGWATELLERLDLPTHLLGHIAQPATHLGPLRPEVASETGLSQVEVVLPGTHDTASAVVAVPADQAARERPDWCYISSGTWSLVGVEVPGVVLNPECLRLNYTNEGGVAGTNRLLKNVTGLWIVQECRRLWRQSGRDFSWEELARLASQAPANCAWIDPDHQSFVAPADMPQAIRTYARRTSQSVPDSEGAIVRTAIESLALKSRKVLEGLEGLCSGRIATIHMVGGGTQNEALCQATANACQRPVVAGPVEATAIGNVMVQIMASAGVGSLAEAREVVRRSFPLKRYEPGDAEHWNEAYQRFLAVIERGSEREKQT